MLFLIKRKILFGLRLCILQLASRVSIRKTFVQFVQKKAQSFAFVALHFCAKNIIRKLLFVQNCVIPLLCNSVLCNFAEQILSKRFNKGLNCINYLFMRFHFFVYKCNDWKEEDDLPKTLFINLIHDDTLQLKMCTISHKGRAVFYPLLILNLR